MFPGLSISCLLNYIFMGDFLILNRRQTNSSIQSFMKPAKNTAIEFYDAVAAMYNTQMSSDLSNDLVRQQVADYFVSVVKEKNVIDFGGGTGLDLKWLQERGYTVFFCEP